MSGPGALGWQADLEWQAASDEALYAHGWDKGVPTPRAMVTADRKLAAMVGREPAGDVPRPGEWRWHISMQAIDRVPSWSELSAACHDLRPGVVFVIAVPPRSWWVNVHPNVLHAWETKDDPLVAQFRSESRGDKPS